MQNALKVMCLEAESLALEAISGINAEIADGPIEDIEDFNVMMIALRNVIKAQQKVIKSLKLEAGLTP